MPPSVKIVVFRQVRPHNKTVILTVDAGSSPVLATMSKEKCIPLRPKYKRYNMTVQEMDCLAWYVLSGCKKEDAYRIFVRPDLMSSPKLLKEYATQFFTSADARNFVSDYKRTLEGNDDSEGAEMTKADREKRKKKAQQNLEDKTIDVMLGDLDTVEKLDAAVRVADRLGALPEKTVTEIGPQRYLPVCCHECKYKQFCEQGVADGDILDCCEHCRALAFAKDHGFVYDPTKLLDL